MQAGFTGTKLDITPAQYLSLFSLLTHLNPTHCHHGDCVGADTAFHFAAAQQDRNIVIHPPIDPKLRAFNQTGKVEIRAPKEYLARNRDVVNETSYLIAVPNGEEVLRSGTWSTVRYARKLKRKIYIILPSGDIREENP